MLHPQAAAPTGRAPMAMRHLPGLRPAQLCMRRPLVAAQVAQLEQPVADSAAAPAAPAAAPAAQAAPAAPPAGQQQQQQQQGWRGRPQQGYRGGSYRRGPSQWTDGRGSRPANSFRVVPETSVGGLSKAIRLNEVLSTGGEGAKLRLVCQSPAAVPRAIQAVAQANATLAQEGVDYRLQVSSSVARRYGVNLYRTLQGTEFTAFLFVSKVSASAIPALPAGQDPCRLSRATVWEKVAGYLQAAFKQGGPQATLLVSCVGYALLTNAYKAMMLSRYNLVRGATANSGAPAADESAAAAAAAPATPAAEVAKDFAFIPTLAFDEVGDGKVLTATKLQLVACEPPAPSASADLRLATPRPSRASSPTRSGPLRRAGAPRPSSAGSAGSSPAGTVTVAAEEWNSMKSRLEDMVDQHRKLMQLLAQTMPAGGAAPAAQADKPSS